MKIGIDLDGVVFNTEMLWAVNAELYDFIGLKRNSVVNREEPRVQEKYDWSKDELEEYFKKYVYIKDFDIIPGAKEVIDLLRNDGHELVVITARRAINEFSNGDNIAADKLEKENIRFDKYYWGQKEKLEACKKENIDIMIDDNYHICEALAKENIKTLYFHSLGRKHIKNEKNIIEVYNWGEIYRYISEFYQNSK